jgi:hypothetical protein
MEPFARGNEMTKTRFLTVAIVATLFTTFRGNVPKLDAQGQPVQSAGARGDVFPGRPSPTATFENGHYRLTPGGIEFDLPADWKYEGTTRWDSNPGETAAWSRILGGIDGGIARIDAWMANVAPTVVPENTRASLDLLIANKARQRTAYPNWTVRPQSVAYITIDGRPAVVAVADWHQRTGKPKIEYLVWLYGSKSWALFFSVADPDQLEALQLDVDTVVRSAKMP